MTRRLRRLLSVLVAGLGVAAALAWAIVLTAPPAAGTLPPPADLIVVLAEDPLRDAFGARLVEAGLAPRVVSTLYDPRCLDRGGARPICASGVRNTVDEALYARQVLAAEGVRRLTVVTSGYHSLRASLVFKIVFMGSRIEVTVVAPPGPRATDPEVAHELWSLAPSAGAAILGRLSPPVYRRLAQAVSM
jgi:uncharacterized SAM-binding protein YcdF (DUF218 family)